MLSLPNTVIIVSVSDFYTFKLIFKFSFGYDDNMQISFHLRQHIDFYKSLLFSIYWCFLCFNYIYHCLKEKFTLSISAIFFKFKIIQDIYKSFRSYTQSDIRKSCIVYFSDVSISWILSISNISWDTGHFIYFLDIEHFIYFLDIEHFKNFVDISEFFYNRDTTREIKQKI